MTEAEQQQLENAQRSDRKARTKLANLCEAVMVRVVELEELHAANEAQGVPSDKGKLIAKKLRAAVVAACD